MPAGNGAWRGDYAAGADLMISVTMEDGVPALTAEIIAGASDALRRLAARADTALIHGEDAWWILEDDAQRADGAEAFGAAGEVVHRATEADAVSDLLLAW